METETTQPLNPWISILIEPRATMQQIIDTDPKRLVLVLAALNGIHMTLGSSVMTTIGEELGSAMSLLYLVIAGPLYGITLLYVIGVQFWWTGKFLGGTGTLTTIRAAFAWAALPSLLLMAFKIPVILLIGQEISTADPFAVGLGHMQFSALLGLVIVEVVVSIWAFFIWLKCLGQVQGFSAWKALANMGTTITRPKPIPRVLTVSPFTNGASCFIITSPSSAASHLVLAGYPTGLKSYTGCA